MKNRLSIAAFCVSIVLSLLSKNSMALPDFNSQFVKEIGSDFYIFIQDHENKNIFYEFPNSLEFVKSDNGDPEFFMSHRGITSPDRSSAGGSLTMSLVAATAATDSLGEARTQIKQDHPEAVFKSLPIAESFYDLIIDNNFISGPEYELKITAEKEIVEGDGTPKISIHNNQEGTTFSDMQDIVLQKTPNLVERATGAVLGVPQAFVVSLNNLGTRAVGLSGQDKDVAFAANSNEVEGGQFTAKPIAIRYAFMIRGADVPYKAKITANFRRIAEYFQQNRSKSRWFGLKKSATTEIMKDLEQTGAINIEIFNEAGLTEQEKQTISLDTIKTTLENALVNGTGFFAPVFKVTPGGGGAGGAGGFLGWGSRSNSFIDAVDANKTFTVTIERQPVRNRWYQFGRIIGEDCGTFPSHYTNLTDPDKNCISGEDIKKFLAASKKCIVAKQGVIESVIVNSSVEDGKTKKESIIDLCLSTLESY